MMTLYNIYYGTIGRKLGVKYHFTKNCKSEEDALSLAKNYATNLYYKNEGKYGIPSFNDIAKESDINKIPIEDLYNSHIDDIIRYYAIPTEIDTISSKNLILS